MGLVILFKLISDKFFDGIVVKLSKNFNNISLLNEDIIVSGSAVLDKNVSDFATNNNLSGFEFLSCIPGTIGGGIKMNAGCFGNETWEFVKSVEVIDRNGVIHHLDPKEFSISYRSVSFPFPLWFLSCEMIFPDKGLTTMEELKSLRDSRIERQPLSEKTCGSVFKNPEGNHAGDLIERSGLKGFRIGGCSISEKHANFIVNDKGATARDIETLINHIQNTVKDRFGIDLDTEVRIIGEHDE